MTQSLRHGAWMLVAVAAGAASYCALLASGLLGDIAVLFYRGLWLAAGAAIVAGVIGRNKKPRKTKARPR